MRILPSLLCAGITGLTVCASAASPAASAAAVDMGSVSAEVIALTRHDLPVSILLTDSPELKKEIKALYPDGRIHNNLNVLLIKGHGKTVLTDTGLPSTADELINKLTALDAAPARITDIIITHAHGDHIGGLLNASGRALFPQAVLHLPLAELQAYGLTVQGPDPLLPSPQPGSIAASLSAVLKAYQGRVNAFTPGSAVIPELPELSALDAGGHTLGHVNLLLSGPDQNLLFFADLMHAYNLQTLHPEIAVSFDADPQQAVSTRLSLMRQAKAQGWLCVGSHVPFTDPQPLP